MPRDFSHIQNPTMVYSPEGRYAVIEQADLPAASAAGWSESPPEWATQTAPEEHIGELNFTQEPAEERVATPKKKSGNAALTASTAS